MARGTAKTNSTASASGVQGRPRASREQALDPDFALASTARNKDGERKGTVKEAAKGFERRRALPMSGAIVMKETRADAPRASQGGEAPKGLKEWEMPASSRERPKASKEP
ncbi:unnamed protein product, partial [Polarella glacialis]